MNIIQIEEAFRKTGRIKNEHYFSRYLKMIDYYKQLELSGDNVSLGKTEKHHILPRALFSEYLDEKWNIVVLPLKAHYLVHYMLYKCVSHRSCVFAFNQMRRVSKHFNKLSCNLYAAVKKDASILQSEIAKNRVLSEERKEMISKLHSGTNTYRNKETLELKRFKVGKEPEGWEPFQTGRYRSPESRQKLGDQMKDRKWQYREDTREARFEHDLLPGFTLGNPPWFDKDMTCLKELSWIHNDAGDELRVNINDGIPDGYKIGRKQNYVNKGFDLINNSGMTLVVDLKEKKLCIVEKSILPNKRYIKHSSAIEKLFLIKYNDKIFSSIDRLTDEYTELPKYNGKRNLDIEKFVVPSPRGMHNPSRRQFCELNQGKTFAEIGIRVIPLSEYEYED